MGLEARGFARVKVSGALVCAVLTDGWRGCEPLVPLPRDAVLEAVALERDVVTLTFSSSKWEAKGLHDAPVLDMVLRTVEAGKK